MQSLHKCDENADPTPRKEKNVSFSEYNEEEIQKLFTKQEQKIKFLKSRLNQVIKQKRKLVSKKRATYKEILLTLFTEDQINHLIKQQSAKGKPRIT